MRRLLPIILLLLTSSCGDQGAAPPNGPGPGPQAAGVYAKAEACGACHPQHFAEWKRSMHAFAGSDPLMIAMASLAAQEPGESIGEKCFACHAPAKVRAEKLAAENAGIDPADWVDEGISCDVCHSVQVVPPPGDISYLDDVDPHDPKLGGLRDPSGNPVHESLFDNSYQTSINCSPCHQVNLDDGTGLENTYTEWSQSVYGGFPVQCQECHMPEYTGKAATTGPVRPDLHRHEFIGVDYASVAFRGIDVDAQKEATRQLLQHSVRAAVQGTPPATVTDGGSFGFTVEVENDQTGHSIPSGTAFSREMWFQVDVRDATGGEVYRSGWLIGPDEDLVTEDVDPNLALFQSRIFDDKGQRTYFSWRAATIDESRLIGVGETRTAAYTVDVPTGTPGPLTVDVKLRFRPIAPEIARMVGESRLLPIEIFDMWSTSFTVAITP